MFRKTNGHAKRFDANAMTLSQLQSLKQRLLDVLGEFVRNTSITTEFRGDILLRIDAIQLELNAIAIKYALV